MTLPKPDLHLRPDDGRGPLVVLVGVGGNRGAEEVLRPLEEDDAPATVLERVGGYWRSSIGAGGRLSKVQDALARARRVIIIGFRDRRVVRAVEAAVLGVDSTRREFPHRTGNGTTFTYTRLAAQPAVARVPGGRFATVYEPDGAAPTGTPHRVRYHVRILEDAALRGRLLVAAEDIGWVNPALYTTDDAAVLALRAGGE
jgi:hypothetical protein